jgi:opacity protein-like surface antigen
LSSTAGAADSFYVSGLAGLGIREDAKWRGNLDGTVSMEDGPTLFAAVGRSFSPFRAEIEGGYLTNRLDKYSPWYGSFRLKGDSTVWSGLLNGYVDFDLNAPVLAYATAGVGMAKVSIEDLAPRGGSSMLDADDTAFAWQVGAGAAYPFTRQIWLDARYRYMATSDLDFEGTRAEFATHIIMIGLRVAFN